MPSNKKQNKNKNKHQQSQTNSNNNNSSNNNASNNNTGLPNANDFSKIKFEQPKHLKLSSAVRTELKYLVGVLLKTVYGETSNPREEWEQYLKIQELLKKIIQLEEPLKRKSQQSTSKANRLANIEKFYQWAKENGIEYDGLEIKEFPGYDLGLQATRDIKKDEMIFSIPRKVIMSAENMDSSFKLSNLKLAFKLTMEAMNANSFWKPYIDLLPEQYSTVLYYSVEQMTELKGSSALSAAIKQCRMIAQLYGIIYHWPSEEIPLAGFKEYFNYDLYRWAVSTVMTRENMIPLAQLVDDKTSAANASTECVLIPFWDMANHRDGHITSYFNMENEKMESTAQDDFKKDEQIFIHYGDRSNAELMIHNGFVNANNAKDSVAIRLGLSPSDLLYDKRAKLLQLLKLASNCDLKVLPAPTFISGELLAFVRVFNMNEEQLEHWIATEERAADLLHIDCALETALEMKTWQYLQTRLMLLLRVFPTSLEQDEIQLLEVKGECGKQQMDYINEMLLEYRVLEKRILAAALDYAKQRTKA